MTTDPDPAFKMNTNPDPDPRAYFTRIKEEKTTISTFFSFYKSITY